MSTSKKVDLSGIPLPSKKMINLSSVPLPSGTNSAPSGISQTVPFSSDSAKVPTATPYTLPSTIPTITPYTPSVNIPTIAPYVPLSTIPTITPYTPSVNIPTITPYVPLSTIPTITPYEPSVNIPTVTPYEPPCPSNDLPAVVSFAGPDREAFTVTSEKTKTRARSKSSKRCSDGSVASEKKRRYSRSTSVAIINYVQPVVGNDNSEEKVPKKTIKR
eukprot:TRINITY_DN13154_c0_g1_i1.p1 TRINITY_DN13154_c0_g1~~TRINITY_DN13154_c0_g1_i1.p1  ORF type:complete len:217 (+),score=22.51 TRINITY_DN13154_c0_g1_i1:95-745(+)